MGEPTAGRGCRWGTSWQYHQQGVDSIRKLLTIWLIAVILVIHAVPSMAADKGAASEQMLAVLWTSQTVERLNKGTWAIPEIIVAQYLADLPETEKSRLKNPALRFLPNNRLQLSYHSKKSGKILLKPVLSGIKQLLFAVVYSWQPEKPVNREETGALAKSCSGYQTRGIAPSAARKAARWKKDQSR